ncbi:MAG: penicillin-binding transpeptidase domain-containing protein [Candidatus Zixiibacteriota bacterium]
MKTHYSKVRSGLVFMSLALVFSIFLGRVFLFQVVRGSDYRETARKLYLQSKSIQAERGLIFDSKGRKIAINKNFKSLCAYPSSRKIIDSTYTLISRVLKKSENSIRREYKLTPRKFCYIKRGLDASEYARFVSSKKKYGLFIEEEPARDYPYGMIGRSILGFVDSDNIGKSGVEMTMEDILAGVEGRSLINLDGLGTEYQIQEIPIKEAVKGNSVVLTIDLDKQQIVEEELAGAIEKYKAKGGIAVFVNPHNGAVIAAAEYCPTEINHDKPMKLSAAAETFEPGSIFKLITAAAVFEDGSIKPSDRYYAEQGCWRLGRNSLRDDHKYDTLTFRSAFELSSNIAIGKIANEIGGEKIYAMARKLGFGQKTHCGMNGESRGILAKPKKWSKFVTSTFAIGHGLSVTPLQMVQAFAIVASGGFLNHPYFVSGCINHEGEIINRHESRPVKVLDDDIVNQLQEFMRGVVTNGTGAPLAGACVTISGKTGTAEKPNLETGGYYKNKFMASFAGYFPADSPLVAGIVILDEPEPIHYGGYTSGPAFKNIAEKFAAIDNYGISAFNSRSNEAIQEMDNAKAVIGNLMRMLDLVGLSRGEIKVNCENLELKIQFIGNGSHIIATHPPHGAFVTREELLRCFTNKTSEEDMTVPDVTGLTMREAINIFDCYGIEVTYRGTGRVIGQKPEAGRVLAAGEKVELTFKRTKGV